MSDFPSSQAIQEVERLTNDAKKPFVIQLKGIAPNEPYLVWDPKEKGLILTRMERAPIAVTLESPEALKEFIENPPHGFVFEGEGPALYYNEESLTLRFDESIRDNAACQLKHSPQFLALRDVASQKPFRQRDFVRFLRIDLFGCFSAESSLLPLVRNLKWTNSAEGGGNIQHGKESMGRSIEARVSGESTIPEEVTLFVPVYENFRNIQPVQCAIEILTDEQAFRLTPYPMSLSNAVEETVEAIGLLFADCGVPAYHGRP